MTPKSKNCLYSLTRGRAGQRQLKQLPMLNQGTLPLSQYSQFLELSMLATITRQGKMKKVSFQRFHFQSSKFKRPMLLYHLTVDILVIVFLSNCL
jgi:hypothetical protein